jgi:hypothetical protein
MFSIRCRSPAFSRTICKDSAAMELSRGNRLSRFRGGRAVRSLDFLAGFLAKQSLNLGMIPPLIREGVERRLGKGVD